MHLFYNCRVAYNDKTRLGVIVKKMCNLLKHNRALWAISYCVVYYCFTLVSGLDVAAHYKPTSRHNCWQRTHSLTLSLSGMLLLAMACFSIISALSFNMLKCNSFRMLFLYSFYALTSVYTSHLTLFSPPAHMHAALFLDIACQSISHAATGRRGNPFPRRRTSRSRVCVYRLCRALRLKSCEVVASHSWLLFVVLKCIDAYMSTQHVWTHNLHSVKLCKME